MRTTFTRTWIRRTLVLLLFALATESAKAQQPAKEPAPPFFVRESVLAFPTCLDPHRFLNTELHRFWMCVYETPIVCDAESGQLTLKPWLLEAMPVLSRDGLTLTMTFKHGIKYADHECFPGGYGREVKAADFIRVIQRHVDPSAKLPFYTAYLAGRIVGIDKVRADAEEAGRLDLTTPIPGVKALDDYTVEIKFVEPYTLFIPLLSMPWMSLIPHEAMQRYGTALETIMVGTGPYLQDRESTNPDQVVFKKNPAYWNAAAGGAAGPLPRNDGVRFERAASAEIMLKRWKEGDATLLDMSPGVVNEFFTEQGRLRGIVQPAKTQVVRTDMARLHYVSFNMKNRFLAKKEVRQALCLAVNRQWYIEKYYKGSAVLAEHIVPPSVPTFAAKKEMPWAYGKRGQQKARELLIKAGHGGGKDLPEFILESVGDAPLDVAELEMLRDAWSQIGVKVQTRAQNYRQALDRIKDGLNEIAVSHWFMDYPDPENFFLMLESSHAPQKDQAFDSPNNGHWKNAEYDKLYRESFALPPGPERGKLFQRMIEIIQDECPWLFVGHLSTWTVVRPEVAGISTRSPYAVNYAIIGRKD